MNHQIPPLNAQVPLIGRQQQAAQASIMQAVQQLSLSIYTRLAADELASTIEPDGRTLEMMAQHSMTAAKAYFTGIGVATFDTPAQEQANG